MQMLHAFGLLVHPSCAIAASGAGALKEKYGATSPRVHESCDLATTTSLHHIRFACQGSVCSTVP